MPKKKKKKSVAGVKSKAKALLNPKNPIIPIAGAVLGFIKGDEWVNAPLDKIIPANVDPKLVAAGQVTVGALVALKMKNTGAVGAVTRFAAGMVAGAGIKRGMKAFGLGGFYSVPGVNGFYDVKAVNGRGGAMRALNGGAWSMDDSLWTNNPAAGMNGYADSTIMR